MYFIHPAKFVLHYGRKIDEKTDVMKVPAKACPVGGLVPWLEGKDMAGIYPITFAEPHPVYVWTYTIHCKPKGGALMMCYNVSQQQIVEAIHRYCQFTAKQSVRIGPMGTRCILARRWDFTKGTMIYKIEGNRVGRETYMTQEELIQHVEKADRPL